MTRCHESDTVQKVTFCLRKTATPTSEYMGKSQLSCEMNAYVSLGERNIEVKLTLGVEVVNLCRLIPVDMSPRLQAQFPARRTGRLGKIKVILHLLEWEPALRTLVYGFINLVVIKFYARVESVV